MTTSCELTAKRCVPCEGGVPKLGPAEIAAIQPATPLWQVSDDHQRIRRQWKAKDFVKAMAFLQQVADLAEAEQHHPDIHLTRYRFIDIEIWTHAIGGLSENDFILAAKIDQLPEPK